MLIMSILFLIPKLPHNGHSTEVTYKIPGIVLLEGALTPSEIRSRFPGPINYLAAAHNQKMFEWSEVQFKVGFPDTNWEVLFFVYPHC